MQIELTHMPTRPAAPARHWRNLAAAILLHLLLPSVDSGMRRHDVGACDQPLVQQRAGDANGFLVLGTSDVKQRRLCHAGPSLPVAGAVIRRDSTTTLANSNRPPP